MRFLAALPEDGRYRHPKDVAEQLGLPGPYLIKVTQALARAGLLDSLRGRNGGYRLARGAHLITVSEVVSLLNDPDAISACSLECVTCSKRDRLCLLQATWADARID